MIDVIQPATPGVVSTPLTLDPIPRDELGQLYRYWTSLREANALPHIAAVKPEHLGFMLGRINLIEVHDHPRRYRLRLVGSTISHIEGRELHGRTTEEIRPAAYREAVEAHYAAAFAARAPSLHEMALSNGIVTRRYWRIILPFAENPPISGVLMTGARHEDRLQDVLRSEAFQRQ